MKSGRVRDRGGREGEGDGAGAGERGTGRERGRRGGGGREGERDGAGAGERGTGRSRAYRLADVLQDADFVERLLEKSLLVADDLDGHGVAVLAVDGANDLSPPRKRTQTRSGGSPCQHGPGCPSPGPTGASLTHLAKGAPTELVHDLETVVQVVVPHELELAVLVIVACAHIKRRRAGPSDMSTGCNAA